MGKKIEVPSGIRCGHWTVIREVQQENGKGRKLLCKCDCGKEKIVSLYSIFNKSSKSCGCYSWDNKRTDINEYIGKKYGKLTIIGSIKTEKYKHYKVKCKCECGNEKITTLASILNGYTQSCGCIKYTNNGVEHKCRERLYKIRQNMIQRCTNPKVPNYNNYGGRGIKVCKEWEEDYFVFRKWALENGYKENLTLDRIDNNGDYEPSNCRWATVKEQSNNTRRTVIITYNNETHNLSEWSEITGISKKNIYDRYKKGYVLDIVFYKGRLPKGHYEKRKE